RDADPAGLGQAFEPRRDVDAVAENVPVLGDNVAQIDADAELDTLAGNEVALAVEHAALDFGGAAHRVDDAGEFRQETVAGGLDDAALVLANLGLDEFAAMGAQARDRAFLVGADQPRI